VPKKAGVLFGFCSGFVQLPLWYIWFRWNFGRTRAKTNQHNTPTACIFCKKRLTWQHVKTQTEQQLLKRGHILPNWLDKPMKVPHINKLNAIYPKKT
jgi:hypothetical protein